MRALSKMLIFILGAAFGLFASSYGPTDESEKNWDAHFSSVMDNLGVLSYIEKGDIDNARLLANITIDASLNRMRRIEGSPSNSFSLPIDTKVRILNAVYFQWKESPPFQDNESFPGTGEWQDEWRQEHNANLVYLAWAREQCVQNPQYDCKNQLERQ